MSRSALIPPSSSEVVEVSNRLESLRRSVDLYIVTQKGLEEERDTLLREKRKHEHTLDRVPVAQELLQNLYDQSSGALIRSCEGAMTDAVQGVIGDESRIGIDAEIVNNQIKVSVGTVVDLKSDERVLRDIISNEGGGLTNVVSTSLRAISLVRSGQRRFIVLDESNCYLNPSQIPPYMAVIRDLAYRAGFQVIMLTHHGIDQFSDDPEVNIITLRPTNDGAILHSTHQADTTTPGIISSIDLENFGAHAKLHVPLIAGLNIVTGPSNVGKSRIRSALRAVIAGDGSSGDIRTAPDEDGRMVMEKAAVVRLTFDGGKTLEWTRKKTGSPVESWVLKLPGESGPAKLDGIVCSGRNGMQWVGRKDVMNMNAIGGLWPALHAQLQPVFALDNPKALSALIAVSKTAIHLQSMIVAVSEEKREAMAEIRRIDKRLNKLSALIFKLESDLSPIKRQVKDAEHLHAAINTALMNINAVHEIMDEHASQSALVEIGAKSRTIRLLTPEIADIDGMLDLIEDRSLADIDAWAGEEARTIPLPAEVAIPDVEEAIQIIKSHDRATQEIARGRHAESLTVTTPDLPDIQGMFGLLHTYDALNLDVWAGGNAAAILGSVTDDRNLASQVADVADMQSMSRSIRESVSIAKLRNLAENIVKSMPLPSLSNRDVIMEARKLSDQYGSAVEEMSGINAQQKEIEAERISIQTEIDTLKPLLGACPTCGHIGGMASHSH